MRDRATEGLSGPAQRKSTLSDEALMSNFKEGDSEAMNQILERYGRPVFGYLYRQIGSREGAEDAYQEVFFKVVKGAGSYKADSKFSAWLFTIARNVVIDQARRDRFRRTESLDQAVGDEGGATRLDLVPGHEADPEEELTGAELHEALERAVAALSEEQREVFLLREKAGLSFKEIADLTKAPLNTVKTRMHYALNNLRKSLVSDGFMSGETT